MKICLTIAGSDSGGGAGIQADIKSMQANGVFAASVITAITAQNTVAVTAAYELPEDLIAAQIDAVLDDLDVAATKTGMLSSAAIITTVAERVRMHRVAPFIVDPVMISKTGFQLLRDDAIDTLRDQLLPLATLVTPNAQEAERLTGAPVRTLNQARTAARTIHACGPRAVLVKGGHLDDEREAVDVLFDGHGFETFASERIDTRHTHGTGDTYAAAIAANLAKGYPLVEAIARAKRYLTEAIRHGLAIGHGQGPTHHFYACEAASAFPFADA